MSVREVLKRLLPGDGIEVVVECCQCGTSIDSNAEECLDCGSEEIVRYHIPQ
jgi:hypothetical protein